MKRVKRVKRERVQRLESPSDVQAAFSMLTFQQHQHRGSVSYHSLLFPFQYTAFVNVDILASKVFFAF